MISTPMASRTRRGRHNEIQNPQPPAAPEPPRDAEEIAAYLAHMTAEMAAMARAAGYELLAYFLDMARIEAKIQADQKKS